jgi:hypothetical protein
MGVDDGGPVLAQLGEQTQEIAGMAMPTTAPKPNGRNAGVEQ